MKRSRSFVFALAAILMVTLEVPASGSLVQHEFRIEEFQLFHDVLRPLQHEALPRGDFQRIRSMATELVTRGEAIVKLDVPDVPNAQPRKFLKVRKKFAKWLSRFATDARTGSNARLKKSFTAVHDSFEQLADLVPSAYPGGDLLQVVSLDCPSKSEAGTEITLTAYVPDSEFTFLWKVTAGKIVKGQNTSTITLDTTGLAGQMITVSVEASDANGHTAVTSCGVQIAPSK